MDLKQIGFYTLSDERVARVAGSDGVNVPLSRCELVLTGRCNFKCPYCRHVGGDDKDLEKAKDLVRLWASQGLTAIRFSGGEPTLYHGLCDLVALAKECGIEKIALSTNGSASFSLYWRLIKAGVNDFSISLDACCAEDGDKMAGGQKGSWNKVVNNIYDIAHLAYTTAGVVLTPDNARQVNDTIHFASTLGVHDIRIIPAAQCGQHLSMYTVSESLLAQYPILKYRTRNFQWGRPVRGLQPEDAKQCGLVLDDMAVCGDDHYPCIIYMREGGKPIGKVGPNMRQERKKWFLEHNTHCDRICQANCLDVCVDYNNKMRMVSGLLSTVGVAA